MAKITPVLWKYKKDGNGKHPIYLRIASNGKTKYLSLGECIRSSHWNDNRNRVRKSHKREAELNKLILDSLSIGRDEIYRLKLEKRAITADHLKAHIDQALNPVEKQRPEEDFFAFADAAIEDMERRKQLLTAKRYRSIMGMFKEFVGGPLSFKDLTVGLLRDWETALIERGNKPNTRASKFRAIRAILNKAIDRGICPQDIYPFRTFSIKRERTERIKLSLKQIKAMEELDLEGGSLIWHTRNYFRFSFYCAGIRFRDVATMKRRNVQGERLRYVMSKTGATKEVKLVSQAQNIVENYLDKGRGKKGDYLFPILQGYDTSTEAKLNRAVGAQNALVNKYLKKIANRCQLPEELSFHVSRHSFADYARQQGWSVYDISKALSHSNLRVTERYLKGFDADGLDKKMSGLFGAQE